MKKILIVILAIIIAGIAYWLVSPLFITKIVNEDIPIQSSGQKNEGAETMTDSQILPGEVAVSLTGSFEGRDGHSASGTARIIEADGKKYVRFESDFKITNGPDLFVHLGRNGQYISSASLGSLKGNEGSQNYEIPQELDVNDYDEVWVWCRAFSVPFGVAKFN